MQQFNRFFNHKVANAVKKTVKIKNHIFDFHGLIFAHLNFNNQQLQINHPHLKV